MAAPQYEIIRKPGGIPGGGPLQAVSWGANRIDLFDGAFRKETDGGRGLEGVGHAHSSKLAGLTTFEILGVKAPGFHLNSQIAATSWGEQRLDVFMQAGTDDDVGKSRFALWHVWHDTGGWGSWERLDLDIPAKMEAFGGTIPEIVAVAPRPGSIHVFLGMRENARLLLHARYAADGWHWDRFTLPAFTERPLEALSCLSVASAAPDRIDFATIRKPGLLYLLSGRDTANSIEVENWRAVPLAGLPDLWPTRVQLVPRHDADGTFPYDIFLRTGDTILWRLREVEGGWTWFPTASIGSDNWTVVSPAPGRWDIFTSAGYQHWWVLGDQVNGPETLRINPKTPDPKRPY